MTSFSAVATFGGTKSSSDSSAFLIDFFSLKLVFLVFEFRLDRAVLQSETNDRSLPSRYRLLGRHLRANLEHVHGAVAG